MDLALAKQHLRVRHDDEDDLIDRYIAAAERAVEKVAHVLLSRREVMQSFPAFAPMMPLFWGPDAEDLTIAYVDTANAAQTITTAAIVGDAFFAPATGWPSIAENSVIQATYTAGFETPEDDLVAAHLLMIEHLYVNRGATSEDVPASVAALCQPYQRMIV